MKRIDEWINGHVMQILRISLGIVYVWFGALKFFPGMSPAETLAMGTISKLTLGLVEGKLGLLLLAAWETSIGLMVSFYLWPKVLYRMILLHLLCTFAPLILFTELSFTESPYAFTLIGQYIVKNIVLISAVLVLQRRDEAVTRNG